MRRTKFTLISLLALVAVIGVAFAVWTFAGDPSDDKTLTVSVDASYKVGSSVAITDAPDNYVVAQTLASIAVEITYTPMIEDGVVGGSETVTLSAVITGDLDDYITFASVQQSVDENSTTPFTLTLVASWKTDMAPTTYAELTTMESLVSASTITITAAAS